MSKRFEIDITGDIIDLKETNKPCIALNDSEICELLNKQDKQISDLETKLAESKKENKELHTAINLSIPNQIAMKDEIERLHTCRDKRIGELVEENEQLKQQLEMKDHTITNLVEDNRASQEWYKKQLAEKEKERELDNLFWKQECDSLQKALAEKEKEITQRLVIQEKDYIDQLALTEKALDLACNDLYWICSFSGKFTKEEFISRKIDYYTKKAKEIIKR